MQNIFEEKTTIDQMGREITFSFPPQRIVSLVPSQTELLFHLGLEERIVGITKFCVHPKEKFKLTPKVGGTKQFNFDSIINLNPDLVIGNKEENYEEGINFLAERFPVWMSEIYTLEESYEMIIKLGEVTDKDKEAVNLISGIKENFLNVSSSSLGKAAYLIWKDPLMVAGNGTFINEMLKLAGLENVFNNLPRYPIINDTDLFNKQPNFILLSSEPFPFKEKHIKHFEKVCPTAKVILVDGEIFSWTGSRLLFAGEYLKNLQKELVDYKM